MCAVELGGHSGSSGMRRWQVRDWWWLGRLLRAQVRKTRSGVATMNKMPGEGEALSVRTRRMARIKFLRVGRITGGASK